MDLMKEYGMRVIKKRVLRRLFLPKGGGGE
jgi:hypothetical protein